MYLHPKPPWVLCGSFAAAFLLGLFSPSRSFATTPYDITFSQFATGMTYTAASGAPNDFSSYTVIPPSFPGGPPPPVTSSIVASYLGLTQQPLICTSPIASSLGIFSMNLGDTSSSFFTVDLQLQLDSNVDAKVMLNQADSPLASITTITLYFGVYGSNTMSVVSSDGAPGSSQTLYENEASFSRSDVLNIHFGVNTSVRMFNLTVNGLALATNADFGSSALINGASIFLGDVASQGGVGTAGIDNLLVVPEPTTVMLVAIGLAGIFGLRHRRR